MIETNSYTLTYGFHLHTSMMNHKKAPVTAKDQNYLQQEENMSLPIRPRSRPSKSETSNFPIVRVIDTQVQPQVLTLQVLITTDLKKSCTVWTGAMRQF